MQGGLGRSRVAAIAMLAVVLSTACALTTASRADMSSWARVVRLSQGQPVEIAQWNALVIVGRLVQADAAGVLIQRGAAATSVQIPRSEVRRVRTVHEGRRDSVANGALTGAAIGITYVVMVLMSAAKGGDGPSEASWATGPLLGGLIGGGVGALIDASRSGVRKETVYAAGRQP